MAVVRRAYALAASGATDREVAAATGLKETHVGEILTNPVYAGRLRTGEALGIAALIDPALWSAVQAARERRRTRAPGRIVKRQYALRLRCLGCRRFLYGDVGRYRHPSPTCEAFRAAAPLVRRQRTPAHDARVKGHSYPQAWYEGAVGALLGEIGSLGEATLAEVVRLHAACRPEVDELALARIDREREAATRKLAQTRDVVAWQAAMGRLDAAEALARQAPAGARLTPPEIVAYLRSLPALWADSGPDARQALTTAIFARTDVLGFERMEYELTPDAIALGLDAALPAVFDLRDQIGEFGRGERRCPATTDLPITMRLAEPPAPCGWLRSA